MEAGGRTVDDALGEGCIGRGGVVGVSASSDGAGGVIDTWMDSRSGDYDVYVQRVDAAGTVLWGADGVPVCTVGDVQWFPQVASDGTGGAYVVWGDNRSGDFDVYIQRVDASGAVLWMANGVPVCSATDTQWNPQIVSDGIGGAIVIWEDERDGSTDIYAQRVDFLGLFIWTTNGVPLCQAAENQRNPRLVSDGTGGAIITWQDNRSGNADIYIQRVDGSGHVLWATNGAAVCTAAEDQRYPQIISDGADGAIITWMDGRGVDEDIYAQRIYSTGMELWYPNGIPLCRAALDQHSPQIAPDGVGGAVIMWEDKRSGDYYVYAARVNESGELVATMLQSHAARFEGGVIRLSWTLSEIDDGARFTILRASDPDWIYTELEDAAIERDGLSFGFTDDTCIPGSVVSYRVDVEVGGMPTRTLFETERITVPELPLTLHQNHPNPFNPNTVIRFYLPEVGDITLDIYNVLGQKVVRLAEGRWEKGLHEVPWDGRNGWGARCSSGVYFMRLRASKTTISRKMVLLR